jgi:hypothetical protein
MPIHPRQTLHHQAEIQGREFAVGSPLQAGEAQTASVADRFAGVRQGGPPGCMCFKSSRFWAERLPQNRGVQQGRITLHQQDGSGAAPGGRPWRTWRASPGSEPHSAGSDPPWRRDHPRSESQRTDRGLRIPGLAPLTVRLALLSLGPPDLLGPGTNSTGADSNHQGALAQSTAVVQGCPILRGEDGVHKVGGNRTLSPCPTSPSCTNPPSASAKASPPPAPGTPGPWPVLSASMAASRCSALRRPCWGSGSPALVRLARL